MKNPKLEQRLFSGFTWRYQYFYAMRRKIARTQLGIILAGVCVILTSGLTGSTILFLILGILWVIFSNVILLRLRCQKCNKQLTKTPYLFVRGFGLGTCAFCGHVQNDGVADNATKIS